MQGDNSRRNIDSENDSDKVVLSITQTEIEGGNSTIRVAPFDSLVLKFYFPNFALRNFLNHLSRES